MAFSKENQLEFGKKYEKALVTGASGFIGSNIVVELLKTGVQVVGVDNLINSKTENVKNFVRDKKFTFEVTDIRDEYLMDKLLDGVDVVFNQAASKSTFSMENPILDADVNAMATLNLLNISKKKHVKKFVHASTGSVFGRVPKDMFPISEETQYFQPASFYGASKFLGENYVRLFNELYGINTTRFRYFHVYGPKQNNIFPTGGVIAIFITQALLNEKVTIFGDGSQIRTFTFVDDVVEANLKSTICPQAEDQVYICSSGYRTELIEIIDKLNEIFDQEIKPQFKEWRYYDVKDFYVDNSKIKKDLKIEFTKLDNGLKKTVDYFDSVIKQRGKYPLI